MAKRIRLSRSTVANLPDAVNNPGEIRIVTDANATTQNGTVAGGGSNVMLVYSNGTVWKIA